MGDIRDSNTPPSASQAQATAPDSSKNPNYPPPPPVVRSPGTASPFYSQYNSVSQLQPRSEGPHGATQSHSPYEAASGSTHGTPSTFNMAGMTSALPEYTTGAAQSQQAHQQAQRTLSGASTPALVYQLQQNLHYSNQSPSSSPYPIPPYAQMPFPHGAPYQPQYVTGQPVPGTSFGVMSAGQQRSAGASPSFSNFPQQPQQYMFYPAPYGAQPHLHQQFPIQTAQQVGGQGRRSSLPATQPTIVASSNEPFVLSGHYSASTRAYPATGMPGDLATTSNTLPVPQLAPGLNRSALDINVGSVPRGPPRKPRQSGHALWVGNLPPGTNITQLKDHFSKDATKDIESLFFIAKSNCAFVNYRTEIACSAAMNRFHDSRFHGVRLVCRLRRSSTAPPSSGIPSGPSAMTGQREASVSPRRASLDSHEADAEEHLEEQDQEQESSNVSGKAPARGEKAAEKFFIVKSLTLQDLEISVRNGIWATQSHNEEALNKAYETADSVFLIFSANKSGEYFGYARMASPIIEDANEIMKLMPKTTTVEVTDAPRSIPTVATEYAPKGRIIDDSARGTIFWEADLSDDEEEPEQAAVGSTDGDSSTTTQSWGKPFRVEWLSTSRLPFYRTRGLRNSWNANREVKIARDGTELETNVGKRLIQMFHRIGPPFNNPGGPGSMPLQHPPGGPQLGPY